MHPHRRRKKRPNYGIRTVEVERGPNGFGFTISGQQPCILSCIVANSPADQAGLRAGDFLISVNGLSVSKIAHDAVVKLIGNSIGRIKMSIAEYYYSDSSDEEIDPNRLANNRKPKYMHKPRTRKAEEKEVQKKTTKKENDASTSNPVLPAEEGIPNPIEYKALVGYLGTIEMPKQLVPNSRLQTVCSCIRKLRQEKRTPSTVLITVLPSCLSLKNSNNQILAIFPSVRVVYISSSSDKDSRYFGLVTSAICEEQFQKKEVEISNSCHVFVTDPKLVDHNTHIKKAESFNITCTSDIITGNCLEFPRNSLYVVSLIQNMYRLQNTEMNKYQLRLNDENMPLVANSPQPSASSNSDSGIGFRDDCGNVSDRILVVEFPAQRIAPVQVDRNHRPTAIDGSNIPASFDLGENSLYGVDNIRVKGNMKKNVENENSEMKTKDDNRDGVLNIRACDGKIPGEMQKPDHLDFKQPKDHLTKKPPIWNRLTVRAMPDPVIATCNTDEQQQQQQQQQRTADIDTGQIFTERAVDVPSIKNGEQNQNLNNMEHYTSEEMLSLKGSVDNISVHSAKSFDLSSIKTVFKSKGSEKKKTLRLSSCENLTSEGEACYKLSPKVYGVDWTKPTSVAHSCEELNTLDSADDCRPVGVSGSLQDLWSWGPSVSGRSAAAISEPDVRYRHHGGQSISDLDDLGQCEDSTPEQNGTAGGAASWAASFEKLLENPLGVQVFAEFLKKEFSAENIYFWTACERFRRAVGPNVATERGGEAQRIYRCHLCPGAPEPVNVDSQARQITQQQLQDAHPHLFEQAQKQIFNLMKFDSYPRFLKSDLYKQCLSGTTCLPPLESGLLLHPAGSGTNTATPSKLKKSLSNAEDRRRKSLLPWHRKIRSKSKDRGETEYQQRKEEKDEKSVDGRNNDGKSAVGSSQSSLTSLDLAMSCSMQNDCVSSQDDMSSCAVPPSTVGAKGALCRVILSDGATTVVQIRPTETVRQLANRLLDKRGLNYSAYEVHVHNQTKAIDLNDNSSTLSGCEVSISQRVVFKIDLPNRKVISVKSKTSKLIVDVMRPILHKYGYGLDQVQVTWICPSGDKQMVDMMKTVMEVDGMRLNVQHCDELKHLTNAANSTKNTLSSANPSLDEITNKVFEQLLHEKAETTNTQNMYDRGSVKSEDWGSEHSSGIFGRFLRRDSALHDRKKKLNAMRSTNNIHHKAVHQNSSSVEDVTDQQIHKKPLIAKWKAGVKVQVACSESDELYEGLKRAQRCRLEDQRGTEINFELPDFLKDKENAQSNNKLRKIQQNNETARFYDNEMTVVNKQIVEKFACSVASTRNLKEEIVSPPKYEKISSKSSSCPTTPSKSFSSLENSLVELDRTVINSNDLSPKSEMSISPTSVNSVLPPPLPPKPKVLPIKPSNWGQNNYVKTPRTPDRNKQALFLEQPTSSFV